MVLIRQGQLSVAHCCKRTLKWLQESQALQARWLKEVPQALMLAIKSVGRPSDTKYSVKAAQAAWLGQDPTKRIPQASLLSSKLWEALPPDMRGWPVSGGGFEEAAQEGALRWHRQLKVEGAPDNLLHLQNLLLAVRIVCDVAILLSLQSKTCLLTLGESSPWKVSGTWKHTPPQSCGT